MTDHIQISDDDGIRTVRFNRAEKKNAITQEMYTALAGALESAPNDGISVILFAGQLGVFSAGNDIQDFMSRAMTADLSATATMQFLRALARSKTPMVAAVDGIAIGVGVTMLFHCDLVYASKQSTFKTPFLNLGLVPEAASSLIAPRIMGHQRAFEMLILGETFDAERALNAGFVNAVSSEGDVEAAALDAAKRLAALPPEALRLSRDLVRGDEDAVVERIDKEAVLFAERLKSDEASEAFMAFMQKRTPNFKKAS
ncbi:MAG: crotonase/enoyl-CoA hydratase family protein [Pseudomonadota bacterium]